MILVWFYLVSLTSFMFINGLWKDQKKQVRELNWIAEPELSPLFNLLLLFSSGSELSWAKFGIISYIKD